MIKPGLTLSTYLRNLVNKPSKPHSSCILCLAPALSGRLCRDCEQDLPLLSSACRTCASPLPVPAPTCGRCQISRPAFDNIQALALYSFPVSAMIGRFKYQGELAMVRPLIALLGERLQQTIMPRPDVLVPCPMHPKRYRKRGFNQASVIAATLGRTLGIPVDYRLCRRPRPLSPQMGLDRKTRLRNLEDAFFLASNPPAHVAIVDDVVTTAATAEQLAKVLKAGGARQVSVWALARTPSF